MSRWTATMAEADTWFCVPLSAEGILGAEAGDTSKVFKMTDITALLACCSPV